MCLVIVYDVIARNLGFQPPASTVALTEYSLLYFTMAAAPFLVREKGQIVIEVIHQRISAEFRRLLDRLILVLCCAVSFVVATLAAILTVEALARGEVEVRSLDAPRWILFAPLVVGFCLMGLEFLRLLLAGDSVFPDAASRTESF
jgi:TRAP-type C4-dicarboxylate transport system permease small subunit